ncbi:MAG: hypothetical protein C4527_00725 [Candidatus Omnitrophota bacterium]|jgi:hypothetical protein|nr:MAG: hypothetical protein C4527_00725 [Candidatus Omnitrophota bacterium]
MVWQVELTKGAYKTLSKMEKQDRKAIIAALERMIVEPQLAAIVEEEPLIPKENVVARNVRVGGKWLDLQGVKEEWVTFDNNFIEGDPGFLDPANLNFQLREDSPVYPLGFKRIPVERIGLCMDEYRTFLE